MKKLTICNYIAAGILWTLGLLEMVFNLLALWEPWQFVGYLYFLWFIPSICLSIYSWIVSKGKKNPEIGTKWLVRNRVVLIISVVVSILALFVFSTWFW